MEKRIGIIAILINNQNNISVLNSIISEFDNIILGSMKLPLKDRNIEIISITVEGDTDQIGALTGKIGRLEGINVRSVLTPLNKEVKIRDPVVS